MSRWQHRFSPTGQSRRWNRLSSGKDRSSSSGTTRSTTSGITYFAEIVSLKQTERSGDRLTYQVTAKPAQRAESMDDPPVLGEAVTYEMVLVEQDGKLLLEEFPYPMVVSDGQIDIDRYQLVK